ncbi:flagellar brake protein [Parasalinivibrio latis]|uniref:PilZ domain-containing protein n=1 Tax=Parasalinivibrio latis TaxID=2952610 RepID=UPI0030E50339
MKRTETLPPDQLFKNVDIGTKLALEIRPGNRPMLQGSSKLVGYLDKRFVLIDYPNNRDIDSLISTSDSLDIVVRGLTTSKHRDIFAFQSHILSTIYRPVKMLAISLPDEIAIHRVRQHPRIPISREIRFISQTDASYALMRDFSIAGCAVKLPLTHSVKVGEVCTIALFNQGNSKVACKGTVVNKSNALKHSVLGVRFDDQENTIAEIYPQLLLESDLIGGMDYLPA